MKQSFINILSLVHQQAQEANKKSFDSFRTIGTVSVKEEPAVLSLAMNSELIQGPANLYAAESANTDIMNHES